MDSFFTDLFTQQEESKPMKHVVKKDVDVAIIGNGPSGLFLSFLLTGYRPFLKHEHPDPFLAYKLNRHLEKSILDQDLQYLSEGLEGRSHNQLALLMDTLLHPNADIGEHLPSVLDWTRNESKEISHVVIGNSSPGGSWHSMRSEVESLSLGSWLELPGYTFQEWMKEREGQEKNYVSSKRVTLGSVAEYYVDYVDKMKMRDNLINDVHITKVRDCPKLVIDSPNSSPTTSTPSPSVPSCLCEMAFHKVDSGVTLNERGSCIEEFSHDSTPDYWSSSDSEDDGIQCGSKGQDYRWCVKGTGDDKNVLIRAKNLVLACGVSENPRLLGVSGEDAPLICHHFSDFCQKLKLVDRNSSVVIIGAGLSAADAVLLCMSKGLKVRHIFRQDPNDSSLIYNKMHHSLYKEYHHVLRLMKGDDSSGLYSPASQSSVKKFTSTSCVFENKQGTQISVTLSLAGVFIGSEAKLDFLPKKIQSHLAEDQSQPINAKTNPVNVDPLTFEAETCPSLYALGPLAGDHFVRFVLGSGLGVCRHIADKLQC